MIKEIVSQESMVQMRRLQPFKSGGFAYKDRRKDFFAFDLGKDMALWNKEKYGHLIEMYQRRLNNAYNGNDILVLEALLEQINKEDEEADLNTHLRYDIIKAQIFLSKYFKWRQKKRDYASL